MSPALPCILVYLLNLCTCSWVQNTYYFHPNEALPTAAIERENSEIKYYQWVAFVLLLQAFMFYMPRIFWNTFSSKCGLFIGDLVQAATNYKSAGKFEKKHTYMDYMVSSIDQLIDDKRRHQKTKPRLYRLIVACFPCFGRFEGNHVLILYMLMKIIYILNAIAQVYLISGFLGHSFWKFGYNFIIGLLDGQGWTVSNSKYFPSKINYKIH